MLQTIPTPCRKDQESIWAHVKKPKKRELKKSSEENSAGHWTRLETVGPVIYQSPQTGAGSCLCLTYGLYKPRQCPPQIGFYFQVKGDSLPPSLLICSLLFLRSRMDSPDALQ